MINIKDDTRKIISTLKSMLYSKKKYACFDILCNSSPSIEYLNSEFGGNYQIDYFSLHLGIDVDYYADITSKYDLDEIKEIIRKELEIIFQYENEYISIVIIKPLVKYYLNWNLITEYNDKNDFIKDIEILRNMLIGTSTGEKRIENINNDYIDLYNKVDDVFNKLDLDNPNPFKTLWESYTYWSINLDNYAKRRVYFSKLYEETLKLIKTTNSNNVVNFQLEYTNWDTIDRTITDIKKQYNEATTPAQFNAIGAMCRSVYDCLADVVYKNEYHTDTTIPFPNDNQYKKKLLEFVLFKLDSKTNKDFRSHCKSMIDLADELTHKKTA
ncbi:MAG: hypothetical protein PHE05_04450, partial [Bacilli bacterium]|nr:hypothetical protein [Bacilli bacterium]